MKAATDVLSPVKPVSGSRDVTTTSMWVAFIVGLQLLWPDSATMAVPSLVAGAGFVAIGFHRWRRTRLFAVMVKLAAALLLASIAAAVSSIAGLDNLALVSDVIGNMVILAFVCIANRLPVTDRWFVWRTAMILTVSAFVVWIAECEPALHEGHTVLAVGLEGLYMALSLTTFVVAVLAVRSRSRGSMVVALMALGVLIGDVMYAGVFAGDWSINDRWMLLPFAAGYAAAAALFMPAMTRRLMLVQPSPIDGWRIRGAMIGVLTAGALVLTTVVPASTTLDVWMRCTLGVLVAFAAAFRMTEMARTETSKHRAISKHVAVDRSTGMPTALMAVEKWDINHEGQNTVVLAVIWDELDDLEMLFGSDVRDRLVDVTARRVLQSLIIDHVADVGVRTDGKIVAMVDAESLSAWAIADRVQHAVSAVISLHEGTFAPKTSIGFSSGTCPARSLAREAIRTSHHAARIGGRCVVSAEALGESLLRKDIQRIDAANMAAEGDSCEASTTAIVNPESGMVVGLRSHTIWTAEGYQFTTSEMERLVTAPSQVLRCFSQAFAESASAYASRRNSGAVPLNTLLFFDVSTLQLVHAASQRVVEEGCKRWSIRPDRIVLMINERDLVVNSEELAEAIERFVDLGVRIGVSQFGDSNLGLSRMRGFPISFVSIADDIAMRLGNAHHSKLVQAASAAGRVLGFDIVARVQRGDAPECAALREAGVSFAEMSETHPAGFGIPD